MFKVNDKVVVKDLETLLKNGYLKKLPNLGDVYGNEHTKYVVFPDFNFFGKKCTVDSIDEGDMDIPYFLSIGIWVPEFMIKLEEVKPEVKVDVIADVIVAEENKEPQQVYINKFNNKPFGKLFIKLINLDPKVAEFSNTTFNKLKKHELQYIAKILQDHGREVVDYNKLTQKELAVYCYKETVEL